MGLSSPSEKACQAVFSAVGSSIPSSSAACFRAARWAFFSFFSSAFVSASAIGSNSVMSSANASRCAISWAYTWATVSLLDVVLDFDGILIVEIWIYARKGPTYESAGDNRFTGSPHRQFFFLIDAYMRGCTCAPAHISGYTINFFIKLREAQAPPQAPLLYDPLGMGVYVNFIKKLKVGIWAPQQEGVWGHLCPHCQFDKKIEGWGTLEIGCSSTAME